MRIEINSKEMIKVVKLCKKVIDKKATLPVLSQIKLDVSQNKVAFSATNLETALKIDIECITQGEGSFLLPLKMVENIKPNGKIVINYENNIEIKKESGCITIRPDDVNDFPAIPQDQIKYVLDGEFINKVKGCLSSVSTDEARYILNGVSLQRDAIVGTDGRRLHVFEADNQNIPEFDNPGIILPQKTIKVLMSAAKLEKGKLVKIGLNAKVIAKERCRVHPIESELAKPKLGKPEHITFKIGSITLVSKLIDGKFPNWRLAVPKYKEEAVVVKIQKEPLINSLKESLDYTDPKSPAVILYFNTNGEKKLDVYTSQYTQKGKYYTCMPIMTDGSPASFGLSINAQYVIDALKEVNDEKDCVKIKYIDPLKPIAIESAKNKNGMFIIMPFKIDEPVISYSEYCEKEKERENIKTENIPDEEVSEKDCQNEDSPVPTIVSES
jgi:DNA polymerase-3 subunit beta